MVKGSTAYSPANLMGILFLVCVLSGCLVSAEGDGKTGPEDAVRQRAERQKIAKEYAVSQRLNAAIDACKALVKSGKVQDASAALEKLRKSIGEPRNGNVEALMARVALANTQVDLAWRIANPYAEPIDAYDKALSEARLVAADVLFAKGDHEKSLLLFDWIAQNEQGELLVLAAEGCGKGFLAVKNYDKAIESFGFSLTYGRQNLYNEGKEYTDLFNRLESELRETRHQREIEMYGEDFVIFRDGEQRRRETHDLGGAVAAYKEIIQRFPNGPYANASLLFHAVCRINAAQFDEGEADLKSFYQSDPQGPYRGEALFELARAAVEKRIDPTLAGTYLTLLDKWIEAARRRVVVNADVVGVRDAAKPLVKPPPTEKRRDHWGNIDKVKVQPGQLVNENTCTWYLDNLEEQCAKMKGFLFFVQGKTKEATFQYRRMIELDPEIEDGSIEDHLNDYTRLKWGVDNGYLFAFPDELQQYEGKLRLAILLGDFYYVTESFDEARSIYGRVLKDEFGILKGTKREYPQFAYACTVYWLKGRQESFSEFAKVLETKKSTFTRYRAMYYIGSMADSLKDPVMRTQGLAILKDLAFAEDINTWTLRGRILYARGLIDSGNKSGGIKLLKSVPLTSGGWKELANYYIKQYDAVTKKHGD